MNQDSTSDGESDDSLLPPLAEARKRIRSTYDEIWRTVDGLEWKEDGHTYFAGACFYVVIEHFAAIVHISTLAFPPPAPIAALIRPQMEAYHRGLWLAHLASDDEVGRFRAGKFEPKIGRIIELLEETGFFDHGSMSDVQKRVWRDLCAFTHSGIELIQLYLTKQGIEQNCPEEQIVAFLLAAEGWALMAAVGVAGIARNAEAAERLLKLGKDISVQPIKPPIP